MTNYALIQKYISLQTGLMYDSVQDLEFALIPYSAGDSSHYWNFAVTNEILTPIQISAIESRMHQNQRTPAVYFENTDALSELAVILKQHGYSQAGEDSWMFYSGVTPDSSRFESVKKVQTPEDLEIYLQTFDASYQKNDPLNPYGDLGDYLPITRTLWMNHHATDRIEYFVAYDGAKPVAVSALTNFEGMGYISNVGSLTSARGKGFGKLVTAYAVNASLQHKNTSTFLLTEDGTNPYRFYLAMGFSVKFTARCMLKN